MRAPTVNYVHHERSREFTTLRNEVRTTTRTLRQLGVRDPQAA